MSNVQNLCGRVHVSWLCQLSSATERSEMDDEEGKDKTLLNYTIIAFNKKK